MLIDHDDTDALRHLRAERARQYRLAMLTRSEGETHVEHARRILAGMTRTPESVGACHRATLVAEVEAWQREKRKEASNGRQ